MERGGLLRLVLMRLANSETVMGFGNVPMFKHG